MLCIIHKLYIHIYTTTYEYARFHHDLQHINPHNAQPWRWSPNDGVASASSGFQRWCGTRSLAVWGRWRLSERLFAKVVGKVVVKLFAEVFDNIYIYIYIYIYIWRERYRDIDIYIYIYIYTIIYCMLCIIYKLYIHIFYYLWICEIPSWCSTHQSS